MVDIKGINLTLIPLNSIMDPSKLLVWLNLNMVLGEKGYNFNHQYITLFNLVYQKLYRFS